MKELIRVAVFGALAIAGGLAAAPSRNLVRPVAPPIPLVDPAIPTCLPSHWVPKRPGHYTLTDWRQVIDSTWGPGLTIPEKLAIFDQFWNTVDSNFASFNNLLVNWDSLRTVYRSEVEDTVSRGRFAAIMNHLAIALRDGHTFAVDRTVNYGTQLLPGVPLWAVAAWNHVDHFGAALTPLPDSSLLVYRVVQNHPLGLEPGDVVLGYDRLKWTDILRELEAAQLPTFRTGCYGSCGSAWTYSLLNAAGMNWHLFDTIDIAKYSTGDTVHLPTSLLEGDSMHLFATDQLDVPGVPMPATDTTLLATYGVVSGTRIGYIYCWGWGANADAEFYNAVSALVSDTTLKGLIIDFRYNIGGYQSYSNLGLHLLFKDSPTTVCFSARSDPYDHFAMEVVVPASVNAIPGNGIGYDKPIAVLVGPAAISAGDQVAYRMLFHPRVRTFGRSTNAAFDSPTTMSMPTDWWARYSYLEACRASDTTYFLTHREFPVDVPVWHTRDAVARGEDTVVTAAMAWIDSAAAVAEELEPLTAVGSPLTATIIRGVLSLPEASSHNPQVASWLLDISGRKVLDLLPGPNDVRALAPGIYFIREAQAQAQAQAVRKVIVAR